MSKFLISERLNLGYNTYEPMTSMFPTGNKQPSFDFFVPKQDLSPPTNFLSQRAEVCVPQPSFIIPNSYKTSSQLEFVSQTTEVHSPTKFISLQRQNLPINHSLSAELFSSRINSQAESIPGRTSSNRKRKYPKNHLYSSSLTEMKDSASKHSSAAVWDLLSMTKKHHNNIPYPYIMAYVYT